MTKAAAERAHVLIEQAKPLGEPPEDPLLLFSVLYRIGGAVSEGAEGDAAAVLSRLAISRSNWRL
jgi:hypothetical protein